MRGRKGRIGSGLVAVSSAAIVSVYAAGYINTTQAGADSIDPVGSTQPVVQQPAPTATPTARFPADRGGRAGRQQPPGAAAPSPTAPAPSGSNQASGLRDGTYSGSGNSRHGGMQVALVVEGGKITSARVTECGTRYSCSKVNPLTNEVIALQAPPIHYVSGATDSSQAYRQAVSNALAQAQSQGT